MIPSQLRAPVEAGFAQDVWRDLQRSPRQLQARYFYDALGSRLFEAICELPWYPIARAEQRLLARHAEAIVDVLRDPPLLVELGPGSGEKLALVAGPLHVRPGPAAVHLIDISQAALDRAQQTLAELPHVCVTTDRGTYAEGLVRLRSRRQAPGSTLVLFLGSNVGNFDPSSARALLQTIRSTLAHGDFFLLGADLVKRERQLLLAYSDPLGVTAAFNKNLLCRINRELDGTFDLDGFDHRAVWNAVDSRVESHLVSRKRQDVSIRAVGLTVTFEAGEHIWTESSHKFDPDGIVQLGRESGFSARTQWIEPDDRFALTLFEAA